METKDWFVSTFADTDISHKEALAVLFSAELGSTIPDLAKAKEENIETLMSSLDLKTKEKSKIRRALQGLHKGDSTESTEPESIKPAEVSFDEVEVDDISRGYDEHNVHNAHYQFARRDVPRESGTFIVPTGNGLWKTIMVVGETGCGKTTTLNSMVSYLWGVDMNDPYRFVLVPPPSSLSAQAHSVTSTVTLYPLRPPKLMYGLNVIDTPGFGDTKGLESDLKIIDDIEWVLCNKVKSLDAIFLIVRSSGRLDAHMKYILNSVLHLFGRDVANNLFTLVTFADGSEPPILAALAEAKIPMQEIFELNNSAFFNGFDPDQAVQLSPDMCYSPGEEIPKQPTPQGVLDRPETESFWKMGQQSMTSLFSTLHNTQPCPLTQTIKNLNRRRQLRYKLDIIHQRMSSRSQHIGNLRHLVNAAVGESRTAEANKDFVIKGERDKVYKEKTPGQSNTICPNCKHTCHVNCPHTSNQHKSQCVAMTDGHCTVCPSKCHWSVHVNEQFEYRTRAVQTKTIRQEMKSAYKRSLSKLRQLERQFAIAWNATAKEEEVIVSYIEESRHLIRQLDNISLGETIMEDENFYTEQRESELSEKKDGWQARVKFLSQLETKAQYCHHIVDSSTAMAAGDAIFSVSRDTIRTSDIDLIRTAQRECTVLRAQHKLERIEDSLQQLTSSGIVDLPQRKLIMSRYTWWRYGCCP